MISGDSEEKVDITYWDTESTFQLAEAVCGGTEGIQSGSRDQPIQTSGTRKLGFDCPKKQQKQLWFTLRTKAGTTGQDATSSTTSWWL